MIGPGDLKTIPVDTCRMWGLLIANPSALRGIQVAARKIRPNAHGFVGGENG